MKIIRFGLTVMICVLLSVIFMQGCAEDSTPLTEKKTVPHEYRWGIYKLDIDSQEVELIYSSSDQIFTSAPRLNSHSDRIVFAQKTGGSDDSNMEIFAIDVDGENLQRLTDNDYWDLYPVWSPDDSRIAFLTMRDNDMDIYMMNVDGTDVRQFYDSGDHDADIHWVGNTIVFTSRSAIWKINEDGSEPVQVTDMKDRGQWGIANLPLGDYDPRLSRDGSKIVFERLENADIPNGGYNFFTVNIDGTSETRLTDNGYSQGLADWSHSGEQLVYTVAAIDGVGKYDIFIMNRDGTDNHNITPDYFPDSFICYGTTFSVDDSAIYFTGEWWEPE
jgi:Tol biopolymer transport system component